MERWFFALPVPPPVHAGLLQHHHGTPALGAERPADWHLTVLFIGVCSAAVLAELLPQVAADCARLAPVPLEVDGLVPFPGVSGPMQVARVRDNEPLRALHGCAGQWRNRLDLAPEMRRFRPHITLHRQAPQAEHIALPLSGLADRLGLYGRAAKGAGQRYRLVADWALSGI